MGAPRELPAAQTWGRFKEARTKGAADDANVGEEGKAGRQSDKQALMLRSGILLCLLPGGARKPLLAPEGRNQLAFN